MVWGVMGWLVAGAVQAGPGLEMPAAPDPPALAQARSPALRAQARSDGTWAAYRPDVWSTASHTGKPVLVSITSFARPLVDADPARVLLSGNQAVLAVKVDAAERPDVRDVLVALTGGEAQSVLLSPAGEVLAASGVANLPGPGAARLVPPSLPPPPASGPGDLWKQALSALSRLPVAPETARDNPRLVSVALRVGLERGDRTVAARALADLEALAGSAFHDVVGGGFFAPAGGTGKSAGHNALVLEALLDGVAAGGSPVVRQAAARAVEWASQALPVPVEPAAPAALPALLLADALAPMDAYYMWSPAEVRGLVGPLQTAEVVAGLRLGKGAVRVLPVGQPLDPGARGWADGLDALAQARSQRPAPPRDVTSYAEATGHLVRALLGASATLGGAPPRLLALEVLESWLRLGYRPGGGFAHAVDPHVGAFGTATLGDQAAMARALLEAHAHTGEARFLDAALDTLDVVHRSYGHPSGGYQDGLAHPAEPPLWQVRGQRLADGPAPAPGAELALALLDAADATDRADLRQRAGWMLTALAARLLAQGGAGPSWGLVAWRLLHPPRQVLLYPRDDRHGTVALGDAVLGARRLDTVLRLPAQSWSGPAVPRPFAVLCAADRCGVPVADPQELRRQVLDAPAPHP